jgi:zinc transporter ZupT
VPAETISAATLVFAAFEPTGSAIWWIVAGGVVANVVYLLSVAVVSPAPKPRWFFYVLAAAAFVGWAISVIDPVAAKAGIEGDNAETQKFAVLAGAAFIIPALDPLLNYLDLRFRAPPPEPPG